MLEAEALALARQSIERWTAALSHERGDHEGQMQDLEQLEEFLRMLAELDRQASSDDSKVTKSSPFGRFRVLEEIGRGGFGIVLRAFDSLLEREVALKIPRPERLLEGHGAQSLAQEAKILASLKHPGIVSIYEAGQFGPLWFIASAYCEGPTLADWLEDASNSMRSSIAPELLGKIADAVHYAHLHGVLHLDLKPENILLEVDESTPCVPHPLVTDFGLAHRFDGPPDASGRIAGTLAYMAPEQRTGASDRIGVATDVYALGAILYELLLGHPPYCGYAHATAPNQLKEPLASPSLLPFENVPRDLKAVCQKCLADAPSDRYESARALGDDLRRFIAGECVQARPVRWPARMARWYRRRPAMAAMASLLALTLVVSILSIAALWRRAESHLSHLQAEEAHRRQASSRMETSVLNLAWLAQEGRLRNLINRSEDAAAIQLLDDFLEEMRAWSGSSGNPTVENNALLAASHSLAMVEGVKTRDSQDLEHHFSRGVVAWRKLVESDPESPKWKRALSLHLLTYASRCRHDHWVWWEQEPGTLDPGVIALIDETYAALLVELSNSYLHNRVVEPTHDMLTAAIKLLESHDDLPDDKWSRHRTLLLAYSRLTRTAALMSDLAESRTAQQKATQLALTAPAPQDCDAAAAIAIGDALLTHGQQLRKQKPTSAALPILDRAGTYLQRALDASPQDVRLRLDLASISRCKGNIHHDLAEYQLADDAFREVIRVIDDGLSDAPVHRVLTVARAAAYAGLAQCWLDGNDQEHAQEALEHAISDYAAIDLRRQDPRSTWLSSIRCLQALGAIYEDQKRFPEAIAAHEKSLVLLATLRPRMTRQSRHAEYTTISEEAITKLRQQTLLDEPTSLDL